MKYLLDTMVVSESSKQFPSASVGAWLQRTPRAETVVSAITFGEVLYGIEKLAAGKHRTRLVSWFSRVFTPDFTGRVVPVDDTVAAAWARLRVGARRTYPASDMLLAATASAHNLTLVTRNVKDFAGLPVALFDPY